MRFFASFLAFFHPARPVEPEPLDIPRLIRAIKAVENWDGHSIGQAGERGPMQFTAATWYKFSRKPHRWCQWKHEFAIKERERVEPLYIAELIKEATIMDRKPTPWVIAALHCAGGSAVASRHIPAMKKDFSQRVENVYYDKPVP